MSRFSEDWDGQLARAEQTQSLTLESGVQVLRFPDERILDLEASKNPEDDLASWKRAWAARADELRAAIAADEAGSQA
ncbi:hypothetical protein [Hyphomicrobium sp. ghe19]|uniref:hypothetical protein n=1 Tax=Hyphomicrobium sp. ghe19 TaxID=2682968 RepID=UPI001366A757|nr:hypothetical protein HYPP_01524 [Hyphomicrobium sp. ghe19]